MAGLDEGRHPRGGDPRDRRTFRSDHRAEPRVGPTPLDPYVDVFPGGTAETWIRLAPLVPHWMYLAGGTALAIHLHHRVSRDLDLFAEQPFDAAAHADSILRAFPDFVPTDIADGTVNGVLGDTKVQFLDASTQHRLVEAPPLAGIRIAGVEDILAMKIKVVMDRGELRDYFDLMCIEKQTELDVVVGMTLCVERYRPTTPDQHVYQAVRALGYFGDVQDDPGLPIQRGEIERYWTERQREIVKALGLR